MQSTMLTLILIAGAIPVSRAAETVLGVYLFSRHGDRTAKSTPPANLTDLGYQEVFTSGTYYRDRYVSSSASNKIAGLNTDIVKLSQIAASAPLDNVLMSSAQGFLQGLYPPVGSTLGQETLRNDTVVHAPLDGYQLIPIQTVTSGTGSEDSAWLQGAGNCASAIVSSNNYYSSPEYKSMYDSTMDFYQSLVPVTNPTFTSSQANFQNAYTIFDLLNVASIHNSSIPSSDLLTNSTLDQLRTLADNHEFNLAYNSSDSIRAIAGSTLAAQVVQALNTTITSAGKTAKFSIQFGAYASFQSLFGLANLTRANPNFFGVPDYTSSMAFELFTTAAPTPFPAPEDLQIRFLFHNGTTSNSSTPTAYPLFGGSSLEISWADFTNGMNKFAIGSQKDWCQACGNSTGVCTSPDTSPSSSTKVGQSAGESGPSKAVCGVIGALVTLVVILGIETLLWLFVVRPKWRRNDGSGSNIVRQNEEEAKGDGV